MERVDGRNDLAVRLLRGSPCDENGRGAGRDKPPFGRRETVLRHLRRKHDEVRALGTRVLRDGFVERVFPNGLTGRFEPSPRDSARQSFHGLAPFRHDPRAQRLVDHGVAEIAVENRLVDQVEDRDARSRARAKQRPCNRRLIRIGAARDD